MRNRMPSILPCLLLFLCSCLYTDVVIAATITHLPGFNGPLPFHLETGYIGVDEVNDVQLFYYFIQSERNPQEDPIMFWLNGGPGCSGFSGLVFEIGPLKFKNTKYNGSLPSLVYNPYSWTKVSSIIFIDYPVGSGFSFSRCHEGRKVGDMITLKQLYKFLIKWFINHPWFLTNHLYIAGDSYGGKVAPIIAEEVSKGIDAGYQPLLNLKGYLVGNPETGDKIDKNVVVPYLHGVGIISDELYESTIRNCEGEDYRSPINSQCIISLDIVHKFISEFQETHILDPKCDDEFAKPKDIIVLKRPLQEGNIELHAPPPHPDTECRSYAYYLSYCWANNIVSREALGIEKGTIREWQRCNRDLSYTKDVSSSIKYHLSVTTRGYRALVYSGDHDALMPFLGTQAWIRSLRFSVVDDWRSWHVGGQVAGYTRTYANNLTFATVKGAGHTAPEYRPKECLAMLRRWLSHKPL